MVGWLVGGCRWLVRGRGRIRTSVRCAGDFTGRPGTFCVGRAASLQAMFPLVISGAPQTRAYLVERRQRRQLAARCRYVSVGPVAEYPLLWAVASREQSLDFSDCGGGGRDGIRQFLPELLKVLGGHGHDHLLATLDWQGPMLNRRPRNAHGGPTAPPSEPSASGQSCVGHRITDDQRRPPSRVRATSQPNDARHRTANASVGSSHEMSLSSSVPPPGSSQTVRHVWPPSAVRTKYAKPPPAQKNPLPSANMWMPSAPPFAQSPLPSLSPGEKRAVVAQDAPPSVVLYTALNWKKPAPGSEEAQAAQPKSEDGKEKPTVMFCSPPHGPG